MDFVYILSIIVFTICSFVERIVYYTIKLPVNTITRKIHEYRD